MADAVVWQRIFLGEAVFIEDARPDVQAAYPTLPRNYRGGWGFMVLTNMLPNQGNGPFTISAHAVDREGHSLSLGSRNITCNNNFASMPFGTIDTPAQGETVSGAAYVNYAWALTQAGKIIPFSGSTITVFVDGAPVGPASYNYYRSDIASFFPGLANTDGPAGFRIIDTTTLANGLHTIVWTVTDSGGATAGLGSRYFRVSNGTTAPVTLSEESLVSDAVVTAALESTPIIGRRGWDPDAPWRAYPIGPSGRAVVRGEELDRFELQLGSADGARYTGSLRFGSMLTALPVGSKARFDERCLHMVAGVGLRRHLRSGVRPLVWRSCREPAERPHHSSTEVVRPRRHASGDRQPARPTGRGAAIHRCRMGGRP